MEIVGNDNRIRALFSDVRAADLHAAPGFTSVWQRAEGRTLQSQRTFGFSLAAVTALLALTVGTFAVWSFYSNRNQSRYQVFAELKATDRPVTPEIPAVADNTGPRSDQKPLRRPVRLRANRSFKQNETLVAKNNEAKATTIDSWQSPTAALLTSPADGLFKSLPQLNENANELKSFLPSRSNEKEK